MAIHDLNFPMFGRGKKIVEKEPQPLVKKKKPKLSAVSQSGEKVIYMVLIKRPQALPIIENWLIDPARWSKKRREEYDILGWKRFSVKVTDTDRG